MELEFVSGSRADHHIRWKGSIHFIQIEAPYEVEIRARGSYFHVIIGRHAYGNYLCIPHMYISAELSRLSDSFRNEESLQRAGLGKVDACSIADAVAEINEYLKT